MLRVVGQKLSVLGVAVLTMASAYGGDSFSVDPNVSEVKSFRVSGSLLRYVQFNTEGKYPCLRLQTLSWSGQSANIISQTNVCRITPQGGGPVSLKKNMASVGFRHMKVEQGRFAFRVVYAPAEVSAPVFYADCEVEVETTGALGEVKCGPRKQLDLDAE